LINSFLPLGCGFKTLLFFAGDGLGFNRTAGYFFTSFYAAPDLLDGSACFDSYFSKPLLAFKGGVLSLFITFSL
jgi:hypothetical protein